jgi:serine/threonine protein kinase
MNPEELFNAALAKPPAERSEFLAAACAGDEALRRRIEELLHAHENPGSFLAGSPLAFAATTDEPIQERPGAVIGPYKLLEQIGEGGMGTVWMAQQTEPVKRLVAVKLIKAGMDSRQVIARFEAERQALALMDHPNIARVLDAGTTDGGRPYFVMDLVKGVTITKYCDEHHLTLRQRLELFLPICQAIQHAHQKGIIHRDLKPSNVLVALYDGKPVPKVIDFGVAKAAGQPLTEQTLVTGFGAIVGTLEYMSPEQAELNQLDIDTRSDIYSLGVMLYELLVGSPPFTRSALEKAGMLEMLRVIREQEPSKPSTKLSTAEGLPTLAANRGTEPAKLSRLVRGELDWIVMKSLEKDRNRRYETANGFAMDVQRYLADEAVQACPPSMRYRLRKFARRNRIALAMGAFGVLLLAVIVGSLATGMVLLSRGNKRIKEQRDLARQQQQLARNAVDDMYSDVAEKWLGNQPGLQSVQKEFLQKALRYYEDFAKDDATDPDVRMKRGIAYLRIGKMESFLGNHRKAAESYDKAVASLEGLVADFPDNRSYRFELARAYSSKGVFALSEREKFEQLAIQLCLQLQRELPDVPEYLEVLAEAHNILACGQDAERRFSEAETNARQYLSWSEKLAAVSPDESKYQAALANAHNTLAEVLNHTSQISEAEKEYRQAIEFAAKALSRSPTNPVRRDYLAMFSVNLADLLRKTGRGKQAENPYLRTVGLYEKLVEDFPETHRYRDNLATYGYSNCANLYQELERWEDAIEASRKAVALRVKLVKDFPGDPRYKPSLVMAHCNLGNLLQDAGQPDKALAEFSKAVDLKSEVAAPHYLLALAQAGAGNVTEYRSACAAMLDLFDGTENPAIAEFVARTLVLCPDAVKDLNRAVKLAEMAVVRNPKNETYLTTLGATLYRAGRFGEAIQRLNEVATDRAAGRTQRIYPI